MLDLWRWWKKLPYPSLLENEAFGQRMANWSVGKVVAANPQGPELQIQYWLYAWTCVPVYVPVWNCVHMRVCTCMKVRVYKYMCISELWEQAWLCIGVIGWVLAHLYICVSVLLYMCILSMKASLRAPLLHPFQWCPSSPINALCIWAGSVPLNQGN